MEEQTPEQPRDEEPVRTMDVTPLTNLDEGVYWTLDESAEHVVLYDAITGRQLTNVVSAYKTYHRFPAVGEDDTNSLMSVVVQFSSDPDNPDAKLITFSGTVLHLEYVQDDEESKSGGGSGSGEDEGGEGDEESEEEQGEGEGDAGEGEGEGQGEGEGKEEGQGQGEGDGEGDGDAEGEGENEGQGGEGTPTGVTEGKYTPKGEHGGGGGIGGHETEGKVKIGRKSLSWEAKKF